ncbi:hypothetical protein SAMN02949497_0710 [Methylomagnum ishizawai]|uniref:Uncharacterized protein n=1 Tax=Methylomagnum ishizawai TaxID=1760988 RepID=A0A1Y6CS27_9GAMM|nr:hypothetical protein [Methylomagnum ishizawai]SMF93429.1 hypothetical protein SAMN02949497_0710 [Methylomagnum ishizawai]
MESQAVKAGLAFAVLMIVGFILVGTTRETPQEKMQGAFLQTSNMLATLALKKCGEAVKAETGSEPYTPSQTDGDHMSHVTLIWENIGSAKRAECRYVMDQGISLLQIDDRKVIENTAATGTAAPAQKPAHH